MRGKSACGLLLMLILSPGGALLAQEGHPLAGTWQGFWGPTPDSRNFLTLILTWDGESVRGDVNPGRFAGEINAITLDSATWRVTFDLDVVDRRSGDSSRLTATGRLLKIGRPDRVILGELTGAGDSSHFSLTRQ